ncbi:elongation factor G [Euzebya sp.]|uniref:elongation factor G n=1 Tax=Euzebya sp. TaxID=1971409 RepID=UPI003517E43F
MGVPTGRIRNVALVGHSGNGKTSLVEAMLFRAGLIQRLGRVEDGTTVTDADPEEHRRTQSLDLGMAPLEIGDHRINLIDTPGYADFVDDAAIGLAVADLAVFVIDATAGVQPDDVLQWRTAARMGVPRMVFINKMDRARDPFEVILADIRARFGQGVELIELPIGEQAAFHGVADLLTEHVFLYDSGQAEESDAIPPEIAEAEHAAHEQLVEDVVATEDDLLERYLEGEEPTAEELERALHDGVDAGEVFPVLVGSATGPVGVDRLMEFICHVGPAPADLPGAPVRIGEEQMVVPADPDGPLVVLAFATRSDDYVGQITTFKVLSGTLHADDVLINSRTGDKERFHGVVRLRGADHEPVSTVQAGDIAAATKLGDVRTGDTLCDTARGWQALLPDPPAAVHGVAIHAASTGEEDKLFAALGKVMAEDRSLVLERNDETHQTVLWGTGEMQIQVVLDRIARRYGVSVETEPVRIAYRETITRTVTAEGKHKKQSGGRGQFAIAEVRFEPLPQGTGFSFDSAVVGGAIPKGLIPAVGAGIEESMARGGLHGFPLVDVSATVLDGKYHSVDSDEMSFKVAGSIALREALPQAGVVVLEPISHVEVTVPVELQGEVMGDLQQRRGQLTGTEQGDTHDEVVIVAQVPTAEIVRYAVDLRSATHGRARFTAVHDRYDPVPPHLVEGLVAG